MNKVLCIYSKAPRSGVALNELLGLAPNCISRGLRTYVASGAYHNVAMHNPRAAACAKEVREILAMRTSVSLPLARHKFAGEG